MNGCLAFLFALLLSLSGGVPAEEPVSTPVPLEANQEVLSAVDTLFSAGDVTMQCFVFPGTGPVSVTLDRETRYEPLRALFAARSWTRQETPEPERTWTRDDWSVRLTSGGRGFRVDASTGSTWIESGELGSGSSSVWYRCEDIGEDLVTALAGLWGGPCLRYALATAPGGAEDGAGVADAYAAAFRESYLSSRFITDFELRRTGPAETDDGPLPTAAFVLNYAVKPADLADPCWQDTGFRALEDGWLEYSVEIHLALEEDGLWRCQFYQ